MKIGTFPRVVVLRLSLYLRALNELSDQGVKKVSSARFGRLVGVKPEQLRKDLGHFGQFGVRGLGYKVQELISNIVRILGTSRLHKVALVGVGNLGRALLAYKGFKQRGFLIAAAFDANLAVRKVNNIKLEINSLSELSRVVKKEKIKMGIIAVPAAGAQQVADQMVRAGIKAILNFAPVRLRVAAGVKVENMDLSIGLETLSFAIKSERRI